MLKTFRRNMVLQLIIIVATTVLFWLPALITGGTAGVHTFDGGPLYRLLAGWLPRRAAVIIGMLLVLTEGFILAKTLFNYKIIGQGTLLPMLLFTTAMSVGSDQLTLTPMLLGLLFIALAVDQQMINTSLLSLPIGKIFGASCLTALAALCWPPLAVFLLTIIFNMINYRQYHLNEWIMILLGFAAPFIIAETYFFLNDQLLYRNYLMMYSLLDVGITIGGTTTQWVASSLFAAVFIISLAASIMGLTSRTINFTKNVTAMILFLFGGLALAAYSRTLPVTPQVLAIPFAISGTMLLIEPKRNEWCWNLVILLVLATLIICNYL